MVRFILNNGMQVERSNDLHAKASERTEDCKGHANGNKPKIVRTRLSDITFAIPQVQDGGFDPSAIEKGMRSERAMLIALAEMYVQSVSIRRVTAITEGLCGGEISAMQVSQTVQQLDEVLQKWRDICPKAIHEERGGSRYPGNVQCARQKDS